MVPPTLTSQRIGTRERLRNSTSHIALKRMDQSMTVGEMRHRHPGEWLLIEYVVFDDELQVKRGRVLAHSPNRDDVYRALLEAKGKKVALEYTGPVPQDLAVVL